MNFFKRKNKIDLSTFIYIKKDAIPESFCSNVIEKFEQDDRKKQGVVGSGINLGMKRSCDLNISELNDWKTFDEVFYKSLNSGLHEYSDFVPDIFKSYNINLDGNDTGYQIQRTRPGDFYDWHHDSIGPRILTFIWYLNDIKNAGYTEFLDGTKIQPETGKFMIFPATWNYMHRGVSPKDETKYICTGWIYKPNDCAPHVHFSKQTQAHQQGM